MNHQSDQYYIDDVTSGNTDAYATLVERYQNFVYTLVFRMVRNREVAEEISQDTFIKAYTALSGFQGKSKFSTWLYTIAYRKSLDYLKTKKRQGTAVGIESDLTAHMIADVKNALQLLEDKERKKTVKNAILELSENEAALITLFYFEEKDIKEISKITGMSPSNIKVKLHRSRKKLYTLLKTYNVSENDMSNERAV